MNDYTQKDLEPTFPNIHLELLGTFFGHNLWIECNNGKKLDVIRKSFDEMIKRNEID